MSKSPAKTEERALNLVIEYLEYGSFSSSSRSLHKKTLPFLILVHTVAGEYRVKIGGQKWLVPVGVSFVVPPNVEVEFEHIPFGQRPMKSLWAHISGLLNHAYEWAHLFQLPAPICGEASLNLGELIRLGQKVQYDESLSAQAAVTARAYDLLSVIASVVPEKLEKENSSNDTRLATLMRFMREHVAQPLSIDELAKSVNLSRSHLHEMVRMTTGKTPHRILLELRVNEAAKMLIRPEVKIECVAIDCGFTCPFHFSKTFKSIKGVPPSVYRAKTISALTTYRAAR